MFHDDCEYDIPAYNQDSVNKLFGMSFGLHIHKDSNGNWDGGLHWDSARFGWRWSKSDKCIELLAYCYDDGVRNWDNQQRFPVVAQVQLGDEVTCCIELRGSDYLFTVTDRYGRVNNTVVKHGDIASWGFTSGLYFGGTIPAPHEMNVDVAKV